MATTAARVPLLPKLLVTAFVAVLVPVYYANYGPTNFLYFCDVSLLLACLGLWTGRPLFASMAAVGILLPQLLWCLDFGAGLLGYHPLGLTAYMFDGHRSLFLRGLSLFHGWLPFLLLFLLRRQGYDRRAFWAWVALGWGLCLVAYLWLPPAGTVLANPNVPVNINYVFGLDDAHPQTWLPAPLYLLAWMLTLLLAVYLPTHLLLRRWLAARSGQQAGLLAA